MWFGNKATKEQLEITEEVFKASIENLREDITKLRCDLNKAKKQTACKHVNTRYEHDGLTGENSGYYEVCQWCSLIVGSLNEKEKINAEYEKAKKAKEALKDD